MGGIVFLYLGETLIDKAMGFCIACNWISMIIVALAFPYETEYLGVDYAF